VTIALVTDSNAQLPPELRTRYDVHVVPLTVVVDGRPYREGVDISSEDFYEQLAAGATVSTAAPSPGEVLAIYDAAIAGGATEIVSVHVGSNTSATCDAVRIAARSAAVPVEVVDTGTASFAVACCVWAAGEELARTGTARSAAEVARGTAMNVDNVFVVGALILARRGGRLAQDVTGIDERAVPVLALVDGRMHAVAQVDDVDGAVAAMTDYVAERSAGASVRVGVGNALAPEVAAVYADRLRELPEVVELVHYRIGPSVGAHTGAGTVGACFFRVVAD
jgi:DegV family protein with EDD domain